MRTRWCVNAAAAAVVLLLSPGAAAAGAFPAHPAWPTVMSPASGPAGGSERMRRAKDLISEDRWVEAVAELRAAAADRREPDRDEALFWLAHSENRLGDIAESVESIRRLQREFPRSRWTSPARSLLIELAQKLGREDVLWRTAAPPPPAPPAARPGRSRGAAAPPPPPAAPAAPAAPVLPPVPPEPPPAFAWLADMDTRDADLRVQALGRLIHADASRAVPLLREIALEGADPAAARRAVFVLAQSRLPEARATIVNVAKAGPEPVRIAAVRELARFGGDGVSAELMDVYTSANTVIKQQVVVALGERHDAEALQRIAGGERDRTIREHAMVALGRAGGTTALRAMYPDAAPELRRAIIRGLFTALDAEGLTQIAGTERDAALRELARSRVRLLAAPCKKCP